MRAQCRAEIIWEVVVYELTIVDYAAVLAFSRLSLVVNIEMLLFAEKSFSEFSVEVG